MDPVSDFKVFSPLYVLVGFHNTSVVGYQFTVNEEIAR
jgi:hypothetical protein